MNFQMKNFGYVKKPFGEFMHEACNGSPQYLRSLSAEKPAQEPARFYDDFPSLQDQFQLPQQLETVVRNQHSSPLRISGPVNMWLHYDVSGIVTRELIRELIDVEGHGERALPNCRNQGGSAVSTNGCGPFQDTTGLVFLAYDGV